MNQTIWDFSSRTERLIGPDVQRRLAASRVALFGLGGVGSFTAEALARAGVGRFLLVDADTVSLSNINRQLVALHSTIGQPKVDVMAARIRDINPAAIIETRQAFYLPDNADTFDLSASGCIVDAIDTVAAKVELAVRAESLGVPLVSCMGAGNKLDPSRFQIADIYSTTVCPLCKAMRKALKARGVRSLTVVYSTEMPVPSSAETTSETAASSGRPVPGSISFVPSAAGLVLASAAFHKLLPVPLP